MIGLDKLVDQLTLLTKESSTPKELNKLKKLLTDVNKLIEKTQKFLQMNDDEAINLYPLQYHVSKAFIDAIDKCQTLLNSFQLIQIRNFYSLDISPTFENAMHLVGVHFVITPDLSDIDDEPESPNRQIKSDSSCNSSNSLVLSPPTSEEYKDTLLLSQDALDSFHRLTTFMEENPLMPLKTEVSSLMQETTAPISSAVTDFMDALEEGPATIPTALLPRNLVSLNAAMTTSLNNLTNPDLVETMRRIDFVISEERDYPLVYLGESGGFEL